MVLFGTFDAVRGATLPAIRTEFGVLYNLFGLSFSLATLGFMAAIYAAGRLATGRGLRLVLVIGLTLVAIAQAGSALITGFLSFTLILLVMQTGGGFLEMGLNGIGSSLFIRRPAVGMSMLHLFFGVGSALAGGFAGRISMTALGWRAAYLAPIILTLPLLMLFSVAAFPVRDETTDDSSATHANDERLRVALRKPGVRMLAALLGIAILLEIGIGSWLVNFLVVTREYTEAEAGVYLSLFFGLFTFGRLVCPYLAEHFGYLRTIQWFGIGALLSVVAGYLFPVWPGLFSLAGLFVSILYPTIMGQLINTYGSRATRLMGPLLVAAITLATIGNWLIAGLHDVMGVGPGFMSVTLVAIALSVTARRAGRHYSFSSNSTS